MQKSLAAFYCLGQEIDWAAVESQRPGKLTTLPTYPFQHERFWFQTSTEGRSPKSSRSHSAPSERPLLGSRLRSPLIKDIVFETHIDAQSLGYLWDHRAFGTGIFPASAFAEMGLSAASILDPDLRYVLEDLTIQDSLILPDEGDVTLQIVIAPEADGQKTLKFFSASTTSLKEENNGWTLHAYAKLRPSTGQPPDAFSLFQAQSACPNPINPQEYYQFLNQMGMEYGPAFQNIHMLWRGDLQALAHVQLPGETPTAGYVIHPALLDACIQTIGATLPDTLEVFLPLAFEQIELIADPGSDVWSHVRIYPGENPKSFNCDMTLFGVDGQEVGRITGLRMKRATRLSIQRLVRRSPGHSLFADWLYRMEWHKQAIQPDPTPGALPTRWLILAEDDYYAGLASLIPGALIASPADAIRQTTADRWDYNPARPEDFSSLIQATQPEGVVCLTGDLQTALHLLQAVLFLGLDLAPGLARHLRPASCPARSGRGIRRGQPQSFPRQDVHGPGAF